MQLSTTRRILDLAPLPLRITLGIIMVAHGHQKVFGEAKDQFPGAIESLGLPQHQAVARGVSSLEFFGGLALIAGIATRLVALLFSGQFLFIIFRMKWTKGLVQGYEFDLALLGGFLSLLLLGGGSGSVDDALRPHDIEVQLPPSRRLRGWLR